MEKKFLKKMEKILKEKKKRVKELLTKIAKKKNGKWEVIFPIFNGGESGSGILEKGADEVEEFASLLPLKESLEKKLNEISIALEKIKKGKYGICEKCQKEIEKERLELFPEAKYCKSCKK